MPRERSCPLCFTSLIIALCSLVIGIDSRAGDEPQAKLPSAVRKALKVEAAGAKVEDIQKLKSGKNTVWEIDVIQSGKSYELHIAADGTLIHKQLEGEAQSADEEADEKAFAKSKGTAKKSKSSEKSSAKRDEDDEDKDEKAEGKSRSSDDDEDDDEEDDEEEELTLKDLPKAVRAALKREAAGGEIDEIEKEKEDGKTVYEATVEFEGEDDDDEELVYELKFSKSGVLLSKILVDDEDEDDEDDQ
ncbi:hypothetical protein AYO47_05900 [Planctomyces sp. SCGC AG-212-M04]|nr:hypothetical protein AYO47_05900 [Planctomyces sp. SCGC AG-212-M04]